MLSLADLTPCGVSKPGVCGEDRLGCRLLAVIGRLAVSCICSKPSNCDTLISLLLPASPSRIHRFLSYATNNLTEIHTLSLVKRILTLGDVNLLSAARAPPPSISGSVHRGNLATKALTWSSSTSSHHFYLLLTQSLSLSSCHCFY